MVRITKDEVFQDGKHLIEAAGKHDDTKPVAGIVTGSMFLEIDTGDVYAFDEDGSSGSEWLKIASLGGGT